MADPIAGLLKRFKASFLLLAQTAVWIAATIATFLLPPPVGTSDQIRVWVRFAQFVITIMIGFALIGALRWKEKRHTLRWAGLSLSFLVLGATAFLAYQFLAMSWTAVYNLRPVVTGSVYTSWGKQYHEQHPDLSPADLLFHAGGKVEQIWTRDSLEQRQFILALFYVAAMPLFTICIMGLVQALQCGIAQSVRRRQVAPKKQHAG
jgi:hypothetical protein